MSNVKKPSSDEEWVEFLGRKYCGDERAPALSSGMCWSAVTPAAATIRHQSATPRREKKGRTHGSQRARNASGSNKGRRKAIGLRRLRHSRSSRSRARRNNASVSEGTSQRRMSAA